MKSYMAALAIDAYCIHGADNFENTVMRLFDKMTEPVYTYLH